MCAIFVLSESIIENKQQLYRLLFELNDVPFSFTLIQNFKAKKKYIFIFKKQIFQHLLINKRYFKNCLIQLIHACYFKPITDYHINQK